MACAAEPAGRATAPPPEGMQQVLFIEVGVGADQHGQDVTKAAVRACKDAISFNSIPSIRALVPGGYDNMKLHLKLGVPVEDWRGQLDLDQVKAVFPYGQMLPPEVVYGGLECSSGVAIEALGDKNDSFYIAVAAVTVGY